MKVGLIGAGKLGGSLLVRLADSEDFEIGLSDVLHGLDSTNTALVTQAVIHAYGHDNRIRVDVQPRRALSQIGLETRRSLL